MEVYDEFLHLISTPTDSEKGDFTNYLGKTFEFEHGETVYAALLELSFSCQLKSEYLAPISDKEEDRLRIAVTCQAYTGHQFVSIDVPSGFYSPESLATLINTRIWALIGANFNKDACKVLFNRTTNRFEFCLDGKNSDPQKRVSLMIFPSMTEVLGLQKPGSTPEFFLFGADSDIIPNIKSKHPLYAISNFKSTLSNFDLVFVYLDVLAEQCVGNTLIRVSEIFPRAKCSKGDTLLWYKSKLPKYVKLDENLRRMSKISVILANEHGEILRFGENCQETRLTIHLSSKK